MSLLEKLGQKRAKKEEVEKAAVIQEKKQTFAEISAQVSELTAKKERINALIEALLSGRDTADKKLENFKSKKTVLKNAYEENKDILAEDDVESFEDMLEENASEPEVKAYRQAGGRDISVFKGAKLSANENGLIEAGKTGELYKAVGTIAEIKKSLKSELPEELGKKVNFSSVTKKGEELSNRDLSFLEIDKYLQTLDQELDELNKQKEEAYLETPEGVKEALSKLKNPEWTFRNSDFQNANRFELYGDVLKLSEKTGIEPIKEVYTEALNKKLEGIAWNKKKRDGEYNKSEEQKLIESYPALNQLDTLKYNQEDVVKLNDNFEKTVKQLGDVLRKDEKKAGSLMKYGLRSNQEDRERQEKSGWNGEELLANNYIKNAAYEAGVSNPYDLIKNLKNAVDSAHYKNWERDARTPESLHNDFEKFNKFLEYLQKHIDEDVVLIDRDSFDNGTKIDLISRVKKEHANFKIEGEENIPRAITVPDIARGNFVQTLDRARNVWTPWQKEKEKIAEISKTAVDDRFAKAQESHFINENQATLETLKERDILSQELDKTVRYLENTGLNQNPEFANTKIKLVKPAGGFYGGERAIKSLSEDENHKRISNEQEVIRKEIEAYANAKKEEMDKESGKIKRALLTFGKNEKLNAISKKWHIFEDFKNDKPLSESDIKDLGLSEDEVAKMKEYRKQRDDKRAEYKKYDQGRMDFNKAVNDIKLSFKDKDVLNGQEMLFSELPERLRTRLSELKAEADSLPEKESFIASERKRLQQEVETNEKKFQEMIVQNRDIIRKYS